MKVQKWHGIHGRQILRKITKYNKKAKYIVEQHISKEEIEIKKIYIPHVFSIERSLDETVEFFVELQKLFNDAYGKACCIFISFVHTKYIGVEALMHLIAMMLDKKNAGIKLAGDHPSDTESLDKLRRYGFFQFVRSNQYNIEKYSTKTLSIQRGINADTEIAKKLCSFAHKCGGYDRVDTIPIYEMLIEMMKNTLDHAFETDNNYWYVFAEDNEDYIKFAFLDTGLGVPNTMKRKFGERFLGVEDINLMKSALLDQEKRSQTRLPYRGQGLPQIYENSRVEIFQEMHIITGRAYCTIEPKQDGPQFISLKEQMTGTLYSWKIKKGAKYDRNKNC